MSNCKNSRSGKITVIGMLLMLLAFASVSVVSAQQKCPLIIKNTSGNGTNFSVTQFYDTTELWVSIPANSTAVWGTLQVSSSTNANVSMSVVPTGTQGTVFVSATKINSNLLASFSLIAVDSLNRTVTIDLIVDCPTPTSGCTRTQGYWKNHPETWATNSLMLGNVSYSKSQLLSIFNTPVRGNGLVSLAHQLIAAKLNRAAGTSVPTDADTAIAAADALIGNLTVPPVGSSVLKTSLTSSLVSALDSYNNGRSPGGPGHCNSFYEESEPSTSDETAGKQ